ncbi:MAG: Pyruvate dehydrogenase E1 component (EC [uncultured Thiotrichaceae bacterium]|uniref:Pyruvate dehydrogenase E1 component n=1 Tax=uncultured Thiotrichaceae bacterium TaxID=298394 RepID=A0A6S6SSG6_9GAMM|nr:MAG: Pyruvate dehydrogenase E1 component (EC [uncultured Thiotrichaceae bacterium]
MANEKTTTDLDPQETQEWIDSLEAVVEADGVERAHYILEKLISTARTNGANLPYSANTAYINTIPTHLEPSMPGKQNLESRIRSYIRWNATAMVVRANRFSSELGGHIASFASSATLYDVGFNHFWKAPTPEHGGDLIYFQGHISPGIYARSFLEGRFTTEKLDSFRQEVDGEGLSSYPHPWLMPNYWQFPTVSMGLGPIKSIYQARFMKYLQDRKLADTKERSVWSFVGDGECDEPETLGAITLAGREKLDNLTWVINCNLQRLDGPVRGNGKIVQELEGLFRGAGWNVIKVLWGSYWDPLLAKDTNGKLQARMLEVVDGEYQNYKAKDGAYVREHFFGADPELAAMVEKMSDDDIWRLNRGGHDPRKVFAAYDSAKKHKGQATVILAHTVKGYGMGAAGEGQNRTHQQKKLTEEEMIQFKDRFNIPLSDEEAGKAEYYRPEEGSEEIKYMQERRKALGGYLPTRQTVAAPLTVPSLSIFKPLLEGSGDREMSTTMAFVRLLTILLRDKSMGQHVVPIVPDEARTFGMEGMFRQLGIYSSVGQLYEPQDKDQVMFYKEDKTGQILEEGINEAGAFSSWIAAATSYSTHAVNMVPFYIFYSMFGFQRIGDLAWAAGDSRARGFLLGATAGRTTLAGEGLQHQDGHGMVQAGLIPNCISYDPTFSYEMAVIMHDGLRRMFKEQEDVYYYITAMNENYLQPAIPKGAEKGIIKGMYLLQSGGKKKKKVQLMGSGTILREVIAAAEMLDTDWKVDADIWSCTSFNELGREARSVERWNRLHPLEDARTPYITQLLKDRRGPAVVATDYIAAYVEQVTKYVPMNYHVLSTDGFGRSDTRKQLRKHFEVDRYYIAVTALKALADDGSLPAAKVADAIQMYNLDADKINPLQA